MFLRTVVVRVSVYANEESACTDIIWLRAPRRIKTALAVAASGQVLRFRIP